MEIHSIKASVYLLSTEEGGRKGPIFSGYRPIIFWEPAMINGGNDARMTIELKDECKPGDRCDATLKFYHPELLPDGIAPGKSFTLREGRKIVGRGTVLGVN